ncbi:DUF5412 family protein [Fictibacillus aquaticus]|uniref:DUF5412 domain-containing protein n=1 Tax=Fictibacillus aquaticus TaxID=2021314 RepID=A0A235F9B3_9BACL|nr:DUF5412 family protein [Fictibacillus aquaticus]OYD57674.1 hypothetical protein CGZ90_13495 [Fictibacillus aquaticus]
MKKKRYILLGVLIVFGIILFDVTNVKLDELPKGKFLSEHSSPFNDNVAKAYLIDDGGATVRASIRVEVGDGSEAETIYWNYDESSVNIKWLDKETIEINGHILNIYDETYHWKDDPDWEKNRGKY